MEIRFLVCLTMVFLKTMVDDEVPSADGRRPIEELVEGIGA